MSVSLFVSRQLTSRVSVGLENAVTYSMCNGGKKFGVSPKTGDTELEIQNFRIVHPSAWSAILNSARNMHVIQDERCDSRTDVHAHLYNAYAKCI